MSRETAEKLYVVVESWRGLISDAQVFTSSVDADVCAARLRTSANQMEDEVTVIETRIQ